MVVSKLDHFEGKSFLITGGTGSFGQAFTKYLLENHNPRKIVIYSRDEAKHAKMAEWVKNDKILNFFVGDVRDVERLRFALAGTIDFVVHAAAMKRVDSVEYNPTEAIETNINGSLNVMRACINSEVHKLCFLSTDKACEPFNLYGATKLAMERALIQGNALASSKPTKILGVRYGNVAGSKGSVVPAFLDMARRGKPYGITHPLMSRFWMRMSDAVELVAHALQFGHAGEIYVPKLEGFKLVDLAVIVSTVMKQVTCETTSIGIRPGEKLYERLISANEINQVTDIGRYFVIHPSYTFWEGTSPRGITLEEPDCHWDSRTTIQMGTRKLLEEVASVKKELHKEPDGWPSSRRIFRKTGLGVGDFEVLN
jgi:FlaA1/EpsC-like NDP-sugar epimerase